MILALLQLAAAPGPGPSFDCARARSAVERSLCANAELAALDREEARLYRLALRGAPAARRAHLVARQREFLAGRNRCGEDLEPFDQCIRNAYLEDIAEMRRIAGISDKGGLSSGPVRYRCDSNYPDAWVTRFALDPEQAWVALPARQEGQPLVARAGDGGRLTGRYDTGQVLDADGRRLRLSARICVPVGR